MATSTFDKNIILDNEAAEKLAKMLSEPTPERPRFEPGWWEENERKVKAWLSNLKK